MVEPLLVVDHADERPFPGPLRQQGENGQPDQEPVRRRADAEAERGPQRLPLRHRQAMEPVQHRRAQQMQPGEGELHLRRHARHADDPAPRRALGQVVQQHGLTHARVAAHHQHPALPGPDRIDEPVEHAALAAPGGKRGHAVLPTELRGHLPGATPGP